MKLFSRILWLAICLAVLASLFIASARIRWEGEYRLVTLAVNLSDMYKLPHTRADVTLEAFKSGGLKALTVSPQDVLELHQQFFSSYPADVAIPAEELEDLREQGFTLFWKLDAWVKPEVFEPYLNALLEMQPRGLLFSPPFDLAPPDLEILLHALEAHPVLLGLIEFGTPSDVERLYHRGYHNFVRVHALKIEERSALSESATVDRYLRAVVERNVRLLELRVLTAEQTLADYQALKSMLDHADFTLALPIAPAPFTPSPWVLAFVWLGLVSLLVLTAQVVGLSARWLSLLWGVGALLGLVGLFALGELTRQGAAWLLAVVVPVATFVFLNERFTLSKANGWLFFLAFSIASVLGGLAAAAFLSTDLYFLEIREFPGVKVALILPLVCVALLGLRKIGRERLQVIDVILWAALGILLIIVLIRSGNFAVWPASESEVSARNWLEQILIVRPRFKEFLMGHPLLLLWGCLGGLRWRPWALAILVAGLVGQVSILNSFMHLHTPLWVTFLRTFHGLWLGAALGGLLYIFIWKILRLSPTHSVD